MSHSTLYGLWPGTNRREKLRQFKNAWGLAPVVWDAIAQRHLGATPHDWSRHLDAIWPLAARTDMPDAMRVVLRMTFDRCYILATDTPRAIDDIAIFLHAYQEVINPAAENHWPAFASALITQWACAPLAFGVHQTSVSENPWAGPYNEMTDTYDPFDWAQTENVYSGVS